MIEIVPLDKQVDKTKISTVPKPPFTMMICASKGGGKSTLILNMLLNPNLLRDKFNEVYIMSPTASLDTKMSVLRNTDFLAKNRRLWNAIKRVKRRRQDILSSNEPTEIVNFEDIPSHLTDENYIDDLDLDALESLIEKQKYTIEHFGKDTANNVLVVMDDLASESNKMAGNRFKKLLFLSRHYKISMIIITQAYFAIPKSIRLNNSQLVLFETSNKKELDKIYEENNAGLSFNDFMKLYKECVKDDYGFMVINYQVPKRFRFANQFKYFLS